MGLDADLAREWGNLWYCGMCYELGTKGLRD